MATNFPASLDSLTNPTPTTSMSGSLSHAGQHSDLNDAVEALQAKVGADSSAVTSSHDYKIAQLEAAATGKILQVLQTVKTDGFTTSSTSFVDVTGVSVTITPTAASSKVLVMVQGFGGNDNNFPGLINLVRDSTNVAQSTGSAASDQTLVFSTTYDHDTTTIGITFLDSPATTSATTYKVQLRSSGGGAVQAIGRREINNSWQGVTTITVMEVSA